MKIKETFKNILMIFAAILIILGALGILAALTIAAYEYHWLLGSLAGCFSCIIIGLFLMNVLEEN